MENNGRERPRWILPLLFLQLVLSLPGRLLNHLADLMERDKDQLAGLDTLDNGKPLSAAVEDVEQSISTFQWDFCYQQQEASHFAQVLCWMG